MTLNANLQRFLWLRKFDFLIMFFGGLYFALFTKEKRDGIGADGSDNGE
jgi:hypothetical protein